MTIEIIPPGASAVVTEHGHHNNHDRKGNGDRYRNHDRFADVRSDIKDSRFDVVQATQAGFVNSGATTNAGFVQAATSANAGFTAGALAASRLEAKMCESFDEVGDDVKDTYASTQKQISDSATATLGGFKDLTALNYQVEGRSLLEAAKNANYLSVQADKNSAQVQIQAQTFSASSQLQAQTFAAAAALQAEKIASASVLLATQYAAAAAAQAAECCCELKEKIGDEGQKTRDLINANTVEGLRDRAARSEMALAAYFSAKVAPTAPVI